MLNNEQKQAIEYFDSTLRVIAGAGSGKTRVLTTKVAKIIEERLANEWQILAITFTNKASKEMKERIEMTIGHSPMSYISTFHSLCYRILREDIDKLGYPKSFVILDTLDKKSILKRIIKDAELKIVSPNTLASQISLFKRDRMLPEDIEVDILDAASVECKRGYQMYHDHLDKIKSLDFDDLILKTEKLFDEFEEVKEKWAQKFRYVLVDEFQDTDEIQYEVVRALSKYSQLTVVGDPDQTIYTWRGAKPNLLTKTIEEDYPNMKTVILNKNYRSTQQILNLANNAISKNVDRIKKDLRSDKTGDKPYYYNAYNNSDEARWIVHVLRDLKKQPDFKYKDVAILFRAAYVSRSIEEQFMANSIPYKMFGGIKFMERKEIKDAMAYLRVALLKDETSIERVINVPKRKVGITAMDKIRSHTSNNNISMWEAINSDYLPATPQAKRGIKQFLESFKGIDLDAKPSKLLKDILEKSGYIDSIDSYLETSRLDNIKELYKTLDDFSANNEGATALDFINEMNLLASTDVEADGDQVNLMTIHGSKGLEFKHVFVIGLCNWIFPSPRSVGEGAGGLEEERRLYYVAATRAKENLFISSFGGTSFSGTPSLPSSFIYESGDRNFQLAKTKNKEEVTTPVKTAEVWYSSGDLVRHTVFGEGVVLNCGNKLVQIAFKKPHGIKSLLKDHKSLSLA